MSRLRTPDVAGWWCLAGAVAVGGGAAVGQTPGRWVFGSIVILGLAVTWSRGLEAGAVLLCLALLGCTSGTMATQRVERTHEAGVVEGLARVEGRLIDDPRPSSRGVSFLMRPTGVVVAGEWHSWAGPTLLVSGGRSLLDLGAGDVATVTGTMTARSGSTRGDPYAGVLAARSLIREGGPDDLLFGAAARIRARVSGSLAPWEGESAGGLVAGFLVGDTQGVWPVDQEALRLAGLSHYVAVSGSNVALFLLLWWVVVGPLALGPRRRAVAGLIGIVLFAVVTRWEASVLRASTMAGIVLIARAIGLPLSAWSALGAAAAGLLLVSPELVFDVGFQLSVAATLGVMTGAGLFADSLPRPIAATLAATVAAQVAVAPILLLRFGAVPLMAPLANLLAAPAVALATMVGAVGVALDWELPLSVAVGAARWVLAVADLASVWPQLGPLAAGGTALVVLLVVNRRTRVIGGTLAAAVLLVVVFNGRTTVELPAVVFLDIGQGDAILVLGESGEVMLMDGGPDPVVLVRKLRQYGIDRIDLMVVSHPHEDHLAGLVPVAERVPVGMLWHPGFSENGDTFERLLSVASERRIEVVVPELGHHTLGSISVEVLGPLRRYAHPNDQSLVLMLQGSRLLLPGDIETIAQGELGPLMADIMKVPHSGSITSDLEWLRSSRPEVAVVSVGPNSFGHPSPEVIEALVSVGAEVVRTDQSGDVVIPLGRSPGSPP